MCGSGLLSRAIPSSHWLKRSGKCKLMHEGREKQGGAGFEVDFDIYYRIVKKIQIITLFPEMFHGVLNNSMLWKAQDRSLAEFSYINLRDFGLGPRKQVDDTPYGGGDGMLLKPEPLVAAIEQAKQHDPSALVILPTPRGRVYRQSDAKELAASDAGLIIMCPRYEGYDDRVINWVDQQYCIGKYVLTGGELPAMVMIDSIVRLLPGVLGGAAFLVFLLLLYLNVIVLQVLMLSLIHI